MFLLDAQEAGKFPASCPTNFSLSLVAVAASLKERRQTKESSVEQFL
jgi:hypothetical protein